MSSDNAFIVRVAVNIKKMDFACFFHSAKDFIKRQFIGVQGQRKSAPALTAFYNAGFFQQACNFADVARFVPTLSDIFSEDIGVSASDISISIWIADENFVSIILSFRKR